MIKPGELIPVDAIIIEGNATFDESSLTGESQPVAKTVGELILSGSLSIGEVITVKASASAEDSQYQQIVKLVRSAAASQAPFVKLAERFSIPFTAMAFALATAMWVISGEPISFLQVIIVATVRPILIAAPLALIGGMSRASKHGIIFKTASVLERQARARVIAFNKTGTLTSGVLVVESVTSFGKHSEEDVTQLAASLVQNSNHAVSQAIISHAETSKVRFTKAKHTNEQAGKGLMAMMHGKQVLVGRYSFLEEHGIVVPAKFRSDKIVHTAVCVALGPELVGVITFTDTIRPASKSTLDRLKQLGLTRNMLITGDNLSVASAVAKRLGIKEVHAEMLPVDKLRVVESVVSRPIIFVGDGVNDAPVLMVADVGIALGARGSAAASEAADLVIMQDNITMVATAYDIAKHTFKIARQGIFIGTGLSLILMGIFATGIFSPLTGALLLAVVDIAVILYALRAHSAN